MNAALETERLMLRQWRVDDFEAFAAMSADPRVMEFLAVDGKPDSRFGSWRALCGMVGHWHLRGFGLFAVIERATGTFVGRCELCDGAVVRPNVRGATVRTRTIAPSDAPSHHRTSTLSHLTP